MTKFEKLLDNKQLKKTIPRLKVLETLSSTEFASSQPFLEKTLGKTVDRVTLYRVLKSFENNGIIHKIIDDNGTANYAICKSDCNSVKHNHNHVHFICAICNKIYCLSNAPLIEYDFSDEFEIETIEVITRGKCKNCK
ncbi:Fur family transcriptional regulator [Pedobacter alpinus]|uniref:Fur family transcriptional regulator n=1 Tax=Pedobacter alpinus TaxID=1590643 RepID=A0ABW5TVH7_9SPHI